MAFATPQKSPAQAGTRQPKTIDDCLEMLNGPDLKERDAAVWALAKALHDLGVGQLNGKEKEVTGALFKLLKGDDTDSTKLGAFEALRDMVQKDREAAKLVYEGLSEHIPLLVRKVKEENDSWAKVGLVRIAKFSAEARKGVLKEISKLEEEASGAGNEELERRAKILGLKVRHESRELAKDSETPSYL